MDMDAFRNRLSQHASSVESMLETLLQDDALAGETVRPEKLMAAMRHGALNGGKRLRPFLVMESAALFGIPPERSFRAAAALECLHSYSLVHDDLPSMDDDALRRGKPTVHIAYDEATAILAGDGLLTLAFDVMSDPETHDDPLIRSRLVQQLARAAGPGGMVGGQNLDLDAEHKDWSETEIKRMQAMKTGALIRFACQAGAILGGASPAEEKTLTEFGGLIGRAFQLIDDILDVTAKPETMGKGTAKDAGRGKATLVTLYGLDKARQVAASLLDDAIGCLEPFGPQADTLRSAARFIVERDH